MALQKCGLNRTSKNKELQPHGSLEFPCAGYESAHTNSIGDFIPWHWHEEFEIIHIVEGSMKLQVLSETFLVQTGETAIINAKALHCASGDPYCKLQSLVFSPLLITGTVNSAFASKYIMPLILCTQFSGIVLKNKKRSVANYFSTAFESLKKDAFAYEFTVREQLSHIMLMVYSELKPGLKDSLVHQDINSVRVATILSFIEQHYPENITLSNIAETVNISERETLRCFKKITGESPIQYLLKYRLIQSASELTEYPDKNISVVAEECGFDSPAYYAKKFKEFYLCTPREYRQIHPSSVKVVKVNIKMKDDS